MPEQQRWMIFIVLSSVFILYYYNSLATQQQAALKARQKAQQAQVASGQPRQGNGGAAAQGSANGASGAAAAAAAAPTTQQQVQDWKSAQRETIRTKSLLVELGSYGGRIESWKIIDNRYSIALRDKPVEQLKLSELAKGGEEMVTDFPAAEYPNAPAVPLRPLELSLSGPAIGSFVDLNRVEWKLTVQSKPSGETVARMESPATRGVRVVKELIFPPSGFHAKLSVQLFNDTDQAIRFSRQDQHGLGVLLGPSAGEYNPYYASYLDVSNALYYDGEIHMADPHLTALDVQSPSLLWTAVQNQYFMQAIVAGSQANPIAAARVAIPSAFHPPNGKFNAKRTAPYRVEAMTAEFALRSGQSKTFDFFLYIGPKSGPLLSQVSREVEAQAKVDPNLQRAVFYYSWDWFRGLCLGMIWLLDWFQSWLGSWGLAIIMLTVAVKLATHPINHKALRANAEFQQKVAKIKPELERINKKYEDDMHARHRATMDLYAAHHISPLAPLKGCLPMLVQLPIFVALYRIFSDYIVLRGASFLWIPDLAAPDRFLENIIGNFDLNILPLLMVATQVISMQLSAKNMEPNQKVVMYIMPVMMLFFFYWLPAGLFLYWTMQNLWQIGHALITNKEVELEERHKEEAKAEVHHGGHGGTRDAHVIVETTPRPKGTPGHQPLKLIDSHASRPPKPQGAKKQRPQRPKF
jgi:YidC/Oxa1 family membrane protein insertase